MKLPIWVESKLNVPKWDECVKIRKVVHRHVILVLKCKLNMSKFVKIGKLDKEFQQLQTSLVTKCVYNLQKKGTWSNFKLAAVCLL